MPAGIAAAIDSSEYQSRNIRSMKFITVQAAIEVTSGIDSRSTSRPPQGRDHQPAASPVAALCSTISRSAGNL